VIGIQKIESSRKWSEESDHGGNPLKYELKLIDERNFVLAIYLPGNFKTHKTIQ